MKISARSSMRFFTIALACLPIATPVTTQAMDLDWSGQFRAEAAMINNYAPEANVATGQGGYEVNKAGGVDARFQTLFLRLRPKLIVNDNVAIKSEWWLGNPVTGFYGVDYPGSARADQRYYNSTFSGGSTISAQRFWAEFLTDIGTFQVGRAPQHWGLGVIHNSGDGLFDRYQSTGDTFKMISKFGNFTVIPAHTKYNFGDAAGGNGFALSEFTLGLRYENLDEDFEGGVNFVRRIADGQSNSVWINYNGGTAGTPGVGGMNLTIWDIYGKKKIGKFDFGIEAPLFSGQLIGVTYKAFALATELKYRASDSWNFFAKVGKVPGQPNSPTAAVEKWSMVMLHPNYRLGLLMFNYNFANFAGNNNPNTAAGAGSLKSIYDNPITNARYVMLGAALTADKWRFTGSFITATADQAAKTGQLFFNSRDRAYSTVAAVKDQGTSLGTEFDLGATLNWDEYTSFSLDAGLLMQGDYYNFVNATTDNDLKNVLGVVASIGVRF